MSLRTASIPPKADSTVVDQLAHKAANWEALKPVASPHHRQPQHPTKCCASMPPVMTGRFTWSTFLKTGKLIPGDQFRHTRRAYKKAKTAAEIAAILNRERIANSKDGFVSHWYIRVRVGSKYANLSVALPTPWKPENEFDLPPAFIRIDGPRDQCKQIVGGLNYRLDHCEPGEVRKRAYIARSICPGDLEPWPNQDETQAGESKADPATQAFEQKGDTVSPLNKPAELPEEMEGPPEVYRVNTGYQFDVEPSCGEEIMIHVYNQSDELKAKAMVEAYLKQHAIDLLKSGVLDRELRVNRLGGEIR